MNFKTTQTRPPEQSNTLWSQIKSYLHFWFIDHGVLRGPHENFHMLMGPFYRSNQPSPAKIRKYKREYQLRTIVNLRGDNPKSSWQRLETQACQEEQIQLIITRVSSRAAPTKEVFRELRDIVESMELPALAHCKSGADRGGLFAVLYRHFRLGHPIEEAQQELHWKYGHFKSGKTGILDYVFECYLKERKPNQEFMHWIENDYDPQKITASFKPTRWSTFFVDVILRRE